MQSIERKILSRIHRHGRGWCFTPKSFVDLGSSQAVRIALFRLAEAGTVRRLARGLYDYPRRHAHVGLVAPRPEAVAKALAERDATRLQSSGAYAANSLGLTDQVPAKVVFLTDGPSRHVKVGALDIILKRTTPRNMKMAGKVSGTLFQALRHIGPAAVEQQHIDHLKAQLSDRDKQTVAHDRRYAPRWMQPVIDAIVGGNHA
ncbi:MAG: hypothetical protein GF331_10355 [Chitinivibrionales bacterium]|nr:hypothetical protein [Chitinivibrionales bacterium]